MEASSQAHLTEYASKRQGTIKLDLLKDRKETMQGLNTHTPAPCSVNSWPCFCSAGFAKNKLLRFSSATPRA